MMFKKLFKFLTLVATLSLGLSVPSFAAKRGMTAVNSSTSQTVIKNTQTLWLGYHIANRSTSAETVKVWSNATSTVTIIAVPANTTVTVNFKSDVGFDFVVVDTSMSVTQSTTSMNSLWFWDTY